MNTAFFFDIDGTLLDFHTHQLSNSTIQSLHILHKKGYKLCIASNRPMVTIRLIKNISSIPWDGTVAANGIEIWDGNNQIKNNGFSKAALETIFSIAKNNHIPIYSAGEEIFFTDHNAIVDEFIKKYDLPKPVFKSYTGQQQELLTLIGYNQEEIISLYKPLKNIHIMIAGAYNIDIFPDGISKYTGICTLMKHWNLPKNEYVCFGDTNADNEMISHVQLGVAMHNAMDSTKKAAAYVCPKDSKDSIRDCLKHFQFID